LSTLPILCISHREKACWKSASSKGCPHGPVAGAIAAEAALHRGYAKGLVNLQDSHGDRLPVLGPQECYVIGADRLLAHLSGRQDVAVADGMRVPVETGQVRDIRRRYAVVNPGILHLAARAAAMFIGQGEIKVRRRV
jgi:hypothetical protein